MRIIASIVFILGLALYVHCETTEESNHEEDGILDCMFASNAGSCLRSRLDRDLDQIELEVTGKKSEPPMSTVVAQAGNIIAEVVDDLQETGAEGIIEDDDAQDDNVGKNQKSSSKIITSMRDEIILFSSTLIPLSFFSFFQSIDYASV